MSKIMIRILIFIFPLAIFGQSTPLQKNDIERIMNRFFDYHVEYKQLDNKLVNRWVKLFIKGLDPEKCYFLHEEVTSYLNMSDGQIQLIRDRIAKKDYSDFEIITVRFHQAIERAQGLREEIRDQIVKSDSDIIIGKHRASLDYAVDNTGIFERQKHALVRFYSLHQRRAKLDTPQRREKVCSLYEKKLTRNESKYLQILLNEDLFVLYIMKAFSKSLDAHSAFFSFEEARDMRMNLEKQFEGIGVVFSESIDGVVVTELIKGGPAEKSRSIESNDLLFEVNGRSVEDLSFEEALEKMKGDKNGRISLGFKRNADEKELEYRVTLQKAAISMDDDRLSYTHEPFGAGILGVLTLNSFYENANGVSAENDMKKAIEELQSKGDVKGIVLDLRENPGGFLTQAVRVAGLFMKSGVVVISKYSGGEIRYLRKIQGQASYDGPLVILISKASASAAEIVAQALQDYGIAVIVGDERSFGKGSIQYQTVTSEKADLLMKVSVGKYYTVSGNTTQIEGVKSDIVVPTKYAPYKFGEKFLEYPLARDKVDSAYEDDLSDIESKVKAFFAAHYLPNLQQEVRVWTDMLPILKANSAHRLANDKNLQVFLKDQKDFDSDRSFHSGRAANWGVEDLQRKESLEILKDMIYLQSQGGNAANF